jgi:hypothetical protein
MTPVAVTWAKAEAPNMARPKTEALENDVRVKIPPIFALDARFTSKTGTR